MTKPMHNNCMTTNISGCESSLGLNANKNFNAGFAGLGGNNSIGGINGMDGMNGMDGFDSMFGNKDVFMSATSTNIYSLPDPQGLVKAVEDATAVYLSIKDHLRTVLEKIKLYLQRSAVLLAELTADIKSQYSELRDTVKKHNRESSDHIRSVLAKKIINLRASLMDKISNFENIRKWQMTVTCSISTTL
ncbi:hypothetical protein EHP00_2323 [Ecytonucleospora hepatopenaei]|uniref:Uncharacterized protein n=1 Tax=Ecytonucleospora hepatopenaei TaxID=646526 RepID=A0A1W0E6A9_9MICR|nr:hypothetical protein EHP00_2323 [Ecytonucleospora hepatopenaei]